MAEPKCSFFGRCGGCSSQHLAYQLQLENKKKALASILGFDGVKVFHDKEYGYRNRMDFVFCPNGVGLRKKGTWDKTMQIDKCVISEERLQALLAEVNGFFTENDAFDLRTHKGTLRYAVIRTPGQTSSISFVLNQASPGFEDAVARIKEFASLTTADNIVITYTLPQTDVSSADEYSVVKGSDMLTETLMGHDFLYSVQGFFQNNTAVAGMMHEHCRSLLAAHETKGAHLLDLYCGVGTFGINNADLFKEVTIVEGYGPAIVAANKNVAANGAKNVRPILLDAMYLKRLEFPKPLYVITDPPRSGMHPKTIERLKELKPESIIYISCNVEQLGKDVLKFKDYKIANATMFDLFPQTPHIEAMVELVKM